MKYKIIILSILAIAFLASCNENNPEQNKLIGLWSEPYHVKEFVKSLDFKSNDTVVYIDKVDTTWNSMITVAPTEVFLSYSIRDNQLTLSRFAVSDPPLIPDKSFTFTTGFVIKREILTLDSFTYNGDVWIKPFVLEKR